MKYTVSVVGNFYKSDSEEVKRLKELGYKFKNIEKFMGNDLSIEDADITVEINTLDELIAFNAKYGRIIFDSNHIEIYNGYRE